MYCPKCGRKMLSSNAAVCQWCGWRKSKYNGNNVGRINDVGCIKRMSNNKSFKLKKKNVLISLCILFYVVFNVCLIIMSEQLQKENLRLMKKINPFDDNYEIEKKIALNNVEIAQLDSVIFFPFSVLWR